MKIEEIDLARAEFWSKSLGYREEAFDLLVLGADELSAWDVQHGYGDGGTCWPPLGHT